MTRGPSRWRADGSRALLVLLTALLALGMVAGAVAAAPRDKDKKGDRGGGDGRDQGGEQTAVTAIVELEQDTDGDLIPDLADNCPTVPNLDQADDDGDGIGNVCQPVRDADGDGVPDELDNCPTVANARQPDNDGDGVGNACDRTPNGEPPPAPEEDEAAPEPDPSTEEGDDGDVAAAGQEADQGDVPNEAPPAAPPPALRPFEPPGGAPPIGPPPDVRPFELPPATFELVARIDAGAVSAGEVGDAGDVRIMAYQQDDEPLDGPVTGDGLPVPVETELVIDRPRDDDGLFPAIEGELDETLDGDRFDSWALDDHFAGGLARTRPTVTEIAGTDDVELYLTQRRGDARGKPGKFSYAIPVPAPGTYRVRLHFAEIYWGATGGRPGGAGKRVFSVDAEGEPKLVDYDINADVGPMTAVVKQFEVEVEDGVLDLRFYGKRDQPMVAAIEVFGAPTGERWVDVDKSTQTVRLMVGGTAVASYQASMSVGPEDGLQDTMPGTYTVQSKVAELTWTPYAQGYFMYWAGFDPPRENGFHSWVMDDQGRVVAGGDGPTWGCVATAPEDAAEIYAFVEIGTRVEIHW